MWGACLFLPNLLLPFCVFALWHCFSVGAHSSHKSEEKKEQGSLALAILTEVQQEAAC